MDSLNEHLAAALLVLGIILFVTGAALFLGFVPGVTGDVAVSVAGGMGLVAVITSSVGGLLVAFAFGMWPRRAATAALVSQAARQRERSQGDDSLETPLSEGDLPLLDETWASGCYRLVLPRARSAFGRDLTGGLVAAAALLETLRAGERVPAGGSVAGKSLPALALWGLAVFVFLMSRRRRMRDAAVPWMVWESGTGPREGGRP